MSKVACVVGSQLVQISESMIRKLVTMAECSLDRLEGHPEECARVELARELLEEMEVDFECGEDDD